MSTISNIPASTQIQITIEAQGDTPQTTLSNGVNPFLTSLNANVQNIPGLSSNGAGAPGAAATSPGAFSMPGIDTGSWDKAYAQLQQIGSSLNKMKDQAMNDLSSADPATRAKGQQELQEFQQIFEAISNAIKIAGDQAKQAIQNSRAN